MIVAPIAFAPRHVIIPATVALLRLRKLAAQVLSLVTFAGALELGQFARGARMKIDRIPSSTFHSLSFPQFRLELFALRHQFVRVVVAALFFGNARFPGEFVDPGTEILGGSSGQLKKKCAAENALRGAVFSWMKCVSAEEAVASAPRGRFRRSSPAPNGRTFNAEGAEGAEVRRGFRKN